MRGKRHSWSEAQKQVITRHLRDGRRDRKSLRVLYSTLPEPRPSLSVLQRYVGARQARATPKSELIGCKKAIEQHNDHRVAKADASDAQLRSELVKPSKTRSGRGFGRGSGLGAASKRPAGGQEGPPGPD
jgi:hypothetical protein